MKNYAYTIVLAALLMLVIVYAVVQGIDLLHVLGTSDVGWNAQPSWNIVWMGWGIVLNGAAILLELMPYFLAGVLLGGFLSEFVSRAAIERHMGAGGGKSIALATCAGGVVPICSCGIVPVLAGLVQAGLPLAPVVAFLIAAPMLNPATVAMTVGMLGWQLAVARIVAVFAIAMTTGLVVRYLLLRGWLPNPIRLYVPPRLTGAQYRFLMQLGVHLVNHPEGLTSEELEKLFGRSVEAELAQLRDFGLVCQGSDQWKLADPPASGNKTQQACFVLAEEAQNSGPLGRRIARAVGSSWKSFVGLSKYILLAVAIAGTIKVLLPAGLVAQWLGGAGIHSVVIAALVAVPMYICTCSDVPMVSALVAKGMGGGAALAFLLGGPGLSIPSLALLSGVFKMRLLLVYAVVSLVGCIAAGTIYNLFLF